MSRKLDYNLPPQAKIFRIYDFWSNLEHFSCIQRMSELITLLNVEEGKLNYNLIIAAAGENFENLLFLIKFGVPFQQSENGQPSYSYNVEES